MKLKAVVLVHVEEDRFNKAIHHRINLITDMQQTMELLTDIPANQVAVRFIPFAFHEVSSNFPPLYAEVIVSASQVETIGAAVLAVLGRSSFTTEHDQSADYSVIVNSLPEYAFHSR